MRAMVVPDQWLGRKFVFPAVYGGVLGFEGLRPFEYRFSRDGECRLEVVPPSTPLGERGPDRIYHGWYTVVEVEDTPELMAYLREEVTEGEVAALLQGEED